MKSAIFTTALSLALLLSVPAISSNDEKEDQQKIQQKKVPEESNRVKQQKEAGILDKDRKVRFCKKQRPSHRYCKENWQRY